MSLEKRWLSTSKKKKSQPQQRRHSRTSSFNLHQARSMTSRGTRMKSTALSWNILSRSWRRAPLLRWCSTTSNIPSKDYGFSFHRVWYWMMTTLRRGVEERSACYLHTHNLEASGSIFSATLVIQRRQSGLISHGAQRTIYRQMQGYTDKDRPSPLLYTT